MNLKDLTCTVFFFTRKQIHIECIESLFENVFTLLI